MSVAALEPGLIAKIEIEKEAAKRGGLRLADSKGLDQNTGQVWMAVQPPSV